MPRYNNLNFSVLFMPLSCFFATVFILNFLISSLCILSNLDTTQKCWKIKACGTQGIENNKYSINSET